MAPVVEVTVTFLPSITSVWVVLIPFAKLSTTSYSWLPLTASVDVLLIVPAATFLIWRSFLMLPTETWSPAEIFSFPAKLLAEIVISFPLPSLTVISLAAVALVLVSLPAPKATAPAWSAFECAPIAIASEEFFWITALEPIATAWLESDSINTESPKATALSEPSTFAPLPWTVLSAKVMEDNVAARTQTPKVVFLKDISSFFILTISLEYKNSEELVLKI